jgi:DNA-binding NarL/FixJ family response regulator
MSHLAKIAVAVDNLDAVEAALKEMGYGVRREKNKHHLHAYAWNMDCDISVLDKNGRQLYIGFDQKADGTIEAQYDLYGSGVNREQFNQQLQQLHSKHKVVNVLREKRWSVADDNIEVNADGSITFYASRWV